MSLPMLDGAVLAGADGLLGVDGMQGRRLTMDFERNCIEIAESEGARRLRGWSTIQGELRFGNLVLIEGRIRGRRINILIDTGAASNFANTALLNALNVATVSASSSSNETMRAYTAGAPILLDTAMIVPEIDFGAVVARNVLAYVGDFHIFDVWGLNDEPTLLVGMDVLTQSYGLSIDYGRGTVHFRFEEPANSGSRIRGSNSNSVTSIRSDR